MTQEVFLRLWNQPDRFDPVRGSLRSFLLAQAHGRAVDAVRSLSSRRPREARDALRTAEAGYDMQHEVWDLAVADQVATAMGELPDEERRAIELAYFDGRTYREVAAAAGPARGHRQEPDPQRHAPHACRPGRRRRAGSRRVMSHDEASELLGAYALDAVDGDECIELEEHLETCPRCRAELDSLREVAAAMGNSVEPLPEGLWSQIASRLPERQEDEEPPPMPRLDARGPSPFRPPADGRSAGGAPPRHRRRHRRGRRGRGRRARHRAGAGRQQGHQPPAARRRRPRCRPRCVTPGHKPRRPWTRARTTELAQFVVVPSGRGYLVSSKLPALGEAGPTSCGASWGTSPISLGLLGGVAEPGRLHHGRLDRAVAPEHHGRAGRRRPSPPPARSSPPGLSDAGAQLLGSLPMSEEDAPKKRRPIEIGAEAEPIKLGSMLLTLVEPHRGHEVAYNRWYERDHFYAGLHGGPVQLRRPPLRRHGRPEVAARPRPVGHHGRARPGAPTSRCTGCSTATSTCGTAGPCAR